MLKPISDDCLDVEGKNIAEVDHSSLQKSGRLRFHWFLLGQSRGPYYRPSEKGAKGREVKTSHGEKNVEFSCTNLLEKRFEFSQ